MRSRSVMSADDLRGHRVERARQPPDLVVTEMTDLA